MKKTALIFLLFLIVASCGSKATKNKLAPYFYPLDGKGRVYVYTDIHKGIVERFHRIYRVDDSHGKHLVVEIYSEDLRIIEAYNYDIDSLNLSDHMVVDKDGKKRQAELFRNQLYPMDTKDQTYFVSRFPGFQDSTLILHEIERRVRPTKPKETIDVMGKKKEALVFEDNVRTTIFNPITRKETEINGRNYSYFVKGIGLVRWHDKEKKSDFQLQRILSESEWLKLIKVE